MGDGVVWLKTYKGRVVKLVQADKRHVIASVDGQQVRMSRAEWDKLPPAV